MRARRDVYVALADRSVQGYRLPPSVRCVNRPPPPLPPPSPPGVRYRPNRANADLVEVEAIRTSPSSSPALLSLVVHPDYIHPQPLSASPKFYLVPHPIAFIYFCRLLADYPAIPLLSSSSSFNLCLVLHRRPRYSSSTMSSFFSLRILSPLYQNSLWES